MEPIATFQGLATGVNFRDLVTQIIKAESRPALLMARRRLELDRKTAAWSEFQSRVGALDAKAGVLGKGDIFDTFSTQVSGADDAVSASATSSAAPGTFTVDVLQLATHEKVGSGSYSDRLTALGLVGEFLIGGRAVHLSSQDTLDDVATAINMANTGSTGSGVSAAVVGSASTGYRIVMTAESSGSTGIELADGSVGLLRTLGFLGSTTSVKHQTSDGALSDGFKSSGADVATLLGLSSPPASGSVTIGSLSVTIDLVNDSLDAIVIAINAAAAAAGSSISAKVVEGEDEAGATVQRLDISGTTSFTDSGRILETLGVLQADRSAIAHQVQGAVFTDGDAVTVATGSTLLTNFWASGSSSSVLVGDTLSLKGTRGDGSTFSKTFTVGVSSTYQDLVDALNSVTDGFGAGSRTATAAISSGRIVVTDSVAGSSQLAVSVISNNEGGGTLDFGAFATATLGRNREITGGLDAQLLVDGAFYSRASNVVTDVVNGVTLTLSEVSTSTSTVEVARDVDKIAGAIESFIQAFNSVSQFVIDQFKGAGAGAGKLNSPLSGDSFIRSMRSRMRDALESSIAASISDFSRLAELGIEITRDGTYEVDKSVLSEVVRSDPLGVRRVFAAYGTSEAASLRYFAVGSDVKAGTYGVSITAAATRAAASSSGFGGTYVDDGVADTMTVEAADTDSVYSIQLVNGMTLTQIVDALNDDFQSATRRELKAAKEIKSDATGTSASESTLLQDLYNSGGTNLGVANGDVFTISGVGSNGSTSFFREWTVTDVATQDLGDLRKEIANAIGVDVVIDFEGGVLTATAVDEGRETFTLTVSSDNAGGGSFAFGAIEATEEGRGKAGITASAAGGEVVLTHDDYGTAAGFTVSYTAGGTNGSASLSLSAATYVGIDVAGTLGGEAAKGVGQFLTGDDDTTVEGLVVQYTGTTTGAAGTVTFSRGIGSLMELITNALLDGSVGSIQGIVDGIDTQKESIDNRIEAFDLRMERRAEGLIKRFSALEESMALAQQQLGWLQAQIGSLVRVAR